MVYLFCGLARPLTPDQRDGMGEKTCCCCRRTCFFKLYADKLEKRRFTQNVQPQKIADYFGITVEELMGTKKEPAGMGELDKQMQEIVELLFVVSIISCYNSYKLKSRGKRNIK